MTYAAIGICTAALWVLAVLGYLGFEAGRAWWLWVHDRPLDDLRPLLAEDYLALMLLSAAAVGLAVIASFAWPLMWFGAIGFLLSHYIRARIRERRGRR